MTRYRLIACSDGPLSEGDIQAALRACLNTERPSTSDALEAALKGAGDDKDGERYRVIRNMGCGAEAYGSGVIAYFFFPVRNISFQAKGIDAAIDQIVSSAKGEV